MVEKMERENLQVITVDAASVIWLQDNKEILINGKPFDIRSISRNGNKLTISGLYDQREEKLQEQLETYNHAENSPSASGNSLLLLSFTIWYLPNHTIDLYTPFVVQSGQTLQKYQDNICRLNKQIIVPPPRCS